MADITISCADCGQEFVFTEGEQQFYKERSIPDPEHCLICRGKYKAKQRQEAALKERVGQGSR